MVVTVKILPKQRDLDNVKQTLQSFSVDVQLCVLRLILEMWELQPHSQKFPPYQL